MKRFLVPIDGSSYSADALKYLAKRKAEGEKFTVSVVNVQPDIKPDQYMRPDMIDRWQKAHADEALSPKVIADLIAQLGAEVHVDIGSPAARIVARAKEENCDEIVMATRGMGDVRGLVVGSVATKVVHLSPIPIVLVK